MKTMKTTCLTLPALLALAVTPLLAEPGGQRVLLPPEIIIPAASDEPASNPGKSGPEAALLQAARLAVHRDIVARLAPPRPIFSRVATPVLMPTYEPVRFAGNERRLPFTIHTRNGRRIEELKGYVRLADQAIFLFDEKTKAYRPASADPRFAAVKSTDEATSQEPLG